MAPSNKSDLESLKGPQIVPLTGERALIAGKTGSGKTAFACWLLPLLPDFPVIIYDSKIEPKFQAMPNAHTVGSLEELHKEFAANKNLDPNDPEYDSKKIDYFIVQPSVDELRDPELMDIYLQAHYEVFHGVPCYIDEVYQFHKNGRPGPGLVALLTRGRSKGITTIISTQRPKWLSAFCLTEADKYFIFFLADRNDRKRFADIITDFPLDTKIPRHYFLYYDHGLEAPVLFKPVPLDPALDTGYSDVQEVAEISVDNSRKPALVWL